MGLAVDAAETAHSSGPTPNSAGPAVLLISAFDLGHQPFGLASPAAWLAAAGARVSCLDLAVQALDEDVVRAADLIAFYLPMHTATRILAGVVPRVREFNPAAHLCAYGLYAPVNADLLKRIGVNSVIGGEFEAPLAALVRGLRGSGTNLMTSQLPVVSLARQDFLVPDRSGLPGLSHYAYLTMPDGTRRAVGYTEATHGCKHLCRHCPIVPVYGGQFRVVQRDVVVADIRQQVHAGALTEALHAEFPELTYDVVIKVEHLVRHRGRLQSLKETGCVLITTAVESVDERILEIFDMRRSQEEHPWITPAQRSDSPRCCHCDTRRQPLPSSKTHPTVLLHRAHRSLPRVPSGWC